MIFVKAMAFGRQPLINGLLQSDALVGAVPQIRCRVAGPFIIESDTARESRMSGSSRRGCWRGYVAVGEVKGIGRMQL